MRDIPWKILSIFVAIAILSTGWSLFLTNDWTGVALNFGTEMAGAVVTYLLLVTVLGTQQKKEDLIAKMSSSIKYVAIPAADELRRQKWLFDGSLKKANLERANLPGANLSGAQLKGANLKVANLQGARLTFANLQGARLFKATLKEANLDFAHLEEAVLKATNLQGASLSGASLIRANLEKSNLQDANLRSVNVVGAKLVGAKLEGAKLEGAKLEGAIADYHTVWPDDFEPEKAGVLIYSVFKEDDKFHITPPPPSTDWWK